MVKILVSHAGGSFSRRSGEIIEIEDGQGRALVASGLAKVWLSDLEYAASIFAKYSCTVTYPVATKNTDTKRAVSAAEAAGVDVKPESKAEASKAQASKAPANKKKK